MANQSGRRRSRLSGLAASHSNYAGREESDAELNPMRLDGWESITRRWMHRGGLQQNRGAKTEATGIVRVLVRQGDQTDFVWVTVGTAVHFCNALRALFLSLFLRVVSEASADCREKSRPARSEGDAACAIGPQTEAV